jgi:hypothetical protein
MSINAGIIEMAVFYRPREGHLAAWQSDYHVSLSDSGLSEDYRARLAQVLPVGRSWNSQTEMWGLEDGDRVEVSRDDNGTPEIFARFDLREWKPALYERFIAFVRDIDGGLQDAEGGHQVAVTEEAFTANLRASRAARFVRDPEEYFRS